MLSTVLLLEVRGTLYLGNLFAIPLRLQCHNQQQNISPTSTILLLQAAVSGPASLQKQCLS